MKISREEVLHIARLAKLGMTGADEDKFTEQLSDILENFEVLKQIDTDGITPTAQAIPLENVMKPDEVAPSLAPEDTLANAPGKEAAYFRIRAVLE